MSYSDGEKAAALIRLAVNKYDYEKTAAETGINKKTLGRWDKTVSKNGNVQGLLERAIQRLLEAVPETLSGKDWALTVAILIDKLQLVQGEPTDRRENVLRSIGSMNDDERDAVIREAEQILARTVGRGADTGGGQADDAGE